jgi:F-type H+-transporting ATPase subunit alpha
MRSIAGSLRLDLAQFRELAAFAQFGSDLDKATQRQLARGERLMEILKQGQYRPLPVHLQILSIFAGTQGHLDKMKVSAVLAFEPYLHRYAEEEAKDALDELMSKRAFDDKLRERFGQICKTAAERFLKEHPEASLA